ncbi:MAG: 50S ribosomal protein L25 [Verrucomicrobiae bacterium]|nr:50S ribosomal protein L25 [Verrucomicrobiae bacterium]
MSQLSISVDPREEIGRGSNRRLRSSGKIPGVIYSKGESRSISIDTKEFGKLWQDLIGHTPLVTVVDGKKEVMALIQDVQRHPVKDFFIHVDFQEVTGGEEITANASIHFVGEPAGVKNEGGSLETHLHEIEIKARPGDIPDFIEVDVSALNVGDVISVSDLPVFPGVTYTSHEDTPVASVAGQMREEDLETTAEAEEAADTEETSDEASDDSSEEDES